MEEGRPADGSGHRPAVELEAGLQASGRYYVNVKINSTRVAVAMAAASVVSVAASIATLGAFYVAYPEETEAALRSLFRFFGAEVLGFENGSILVELCLHTKESFRAFMDAFETKAVKQRLQEELSKIGFKGELEVTIVNDKEVYDAFNLIRKEMKKGYSDLEEDSDSSGVETMESEEELSQPPSPGEPLTPPVSDLEELREGSKSADPKSREEMEKRSSDFEADSDSSGVETIESEEELSQPPSPGEPLALSFGDLEELLREGSESVDPQSRKEMEKRSSDFETASDSSGFESMESEEEFSPQHSPRELLTPPLQSSDLEGEELAEEVTPASDKPRRGIMMKAAAASPLGCILKLINNSSR